VINITVSTILVSAKEVFCFEQGLGEEIIRLIVDSCQNLKKLNLDSSYWILDGGAVHVIEKLGKQLTTLVLGGVHLTDVAYSYLNKCAR
jgi:hypothetical protein